MKKQETMRVTRLYTGDDGESRFEDIEVELADAGPIGFLSPAVPVGRLIFRLTDGDYDYDWHNAPERQYVIMLEGEVDIEAGSGEVRRFGPGDILLVEDVDGRGHRSRAVDGRPRRSLFITLPPKDDAGSPGD
ncbi:hypothetical protein EDC39_11564 [Geothermobacter ehrlichii]|uniref:Cupin domain-containing protein n=1 Tax=Geothermobacter ehrlichii TaxID=213224 RepID=A0A5D3WGT4_9BACT|nr:hypothetical protein [Geothermobacter ehrlichii]TYO96117.1 hypothetical protein EDC39_11564 [Geothermobacter ehrlichii]